MTVYEISRNGPQVTEAEARRLTEDVKADARALWLKMSNLHKRGVHTALGYTNWGAYCVGELEILSGATAYRLLAAGQVMDEFVSGERKDGTILTRENRELPAPRTQGVATELARVASPEERLEVWEEMVEAHGETPTKAEAREVVDRRLHPEPAQQPAPPPKPEWLGMIEVFAGEMSLLQFSGSEPNAETCRHLLDMWPRVQSILERGAA